MGRLQRSDYIRKAINYVKILLEKGADPNARDEWGIGHLIHYAIWTGNMDLVKLLIDHEDCDMEALTGGRSCRGPAATLGVHLACFGVLTLSQQVALEGGPPALLEGLLADSFPQAWPAENALFQNVQTLCVTALTRQE